MERFRNALMLKLALIFFIALSFITINARERQARVIHTEKRAAHTGNWLELGSNEQQSVVELIRLLEKSETGKKLLGQAQIRARETGRTLIDVISAGEGSLTDTTLIRRFTPENPDRVVYETRSVVTVNRHLRVREAVLDLAHELTHFTYRQAFNPYQTQFTLKSFVRSTVEGEGGEVEAFLIECQVLFELYPEAGSSNTHCQQIVDPLTGRLSKERGIQNFYRIGAFRDHFVKEMADFNLAEGDLPLLSGLEPLFISSAWGLPYPVAAFREYVTIMGRACENDLKRLEILKTSLGRAPASLESSLRVRQLEGDYHSRCGDFRADLHAARMP
jgi:hypothetical protein